MEDKFLTLTVTNPDCHLWSLLTLPLMNTTEKNATLKSNMESAQQRMRDLANAHKSDKELKIRAMVYLRLRDYRQKSVQSQAGKNLTK